MSMYEDWCAENERLRRAMIQAATVLAAQDCEHPARQARIMLREALGELHRTDQACDECGAHAIYASRVHIECAACGFRLMSG